MIYYKIDVLEELKKRGYPPKRIREENLISQATLQNLRQKKAVNFATLDILCKLLNRQPGQLIGFSKDQNQH